MPEPTAADDAARRTDILLSQRVIGQATGLLMAGHGVGADAAFAMLVAFSQRSNIKLRQVAADLVRQAEYSPPAGCICDLARSGAKKRH